MSETHLKLLQPEDAAGAGLSDDDLMLLSRQDRHDGFEILVERHQTFVYALAARFLGDRTLGRDVAQDVFLSIWAERERYKARGRFKSYLVSVTLNRCRHLARQRGSHQRKATGLGREHRGQRPAADLPLEEVLEMERARELHGVLAELPEKLRLALILRYVNGLALREIASLTRQPTGTVKSHVFRGLKRLHQKLTAGAS